jgi:hypothetical protein
MAREEWTRAQIEDMCVRYDAGEGIRALSERYDCSREAIRFVVFTRHLGPSRRVIPDPGSEGEGKEVRFDAVPVVRLLKPVDPQPSINPS